MVHSVGIKIRTLKKRISLNWSVDGIKFYAFVAFVFEIKYKKRRRYMLYVADSIYLA